MADLKPKGPKDNSRRKGIPAQLKAEKRREAQERQAKYDKLTIQQKLALPTCGTKERAKLLSRLK